MEGKPAASRSPSYGEFEPHFEWQHEGNRDVLVLHIPEFKKQHLRVQVSNRGILKISGERSIDSSQKTKFYKEVEVPNYCDIERISAKFATGRLIVTMPRALNAPTVQTKGPEVAGSGVDQKKSEATEALGEKLAPAEDIKTAGRSKEEKKPSPNAASTDGKKVPPKQKGSVSRIKSCGKMSLNVALAVAVLAALTSYVFYMYRAVVLED